MIYGPCSALTATQIMMCLGGMSAQFLENMKTFFFPFYFLTTNHFIPTEADTGPVSTLAMNYDGQAFHCEPAAEVLHAVLCLTKHFEKQNPQMSVVSNVIAGEQIRKVSVCVCEEIILVALS